MNLKTANERLAYLRKEKKLTLRELAEPIGVTLQSVSRWENGDTPLPKMGAQAIENAFGISAAWLLDGEGEMMVGDRVAENVTPYVAGTDEEYLIIRFAELKASAGHGSIVELEPLNTAHLLFGRQWLNERIGIAHERLVVLSVDGDSMMPTLSPNDLIMIDTSAMERGFKDGIWLFSMDNAVHIKRVSHRGRGQFVASSDNKEYHPFTLEEPYHFIGRLVWSDRRW